MTCNRDMSNIEIAWEIDGGQITAEESVLAMIDVIQSKSIEHTGTFWTWKNEVSWNTKKEIAGLVTDVLCRNTRGDCIIR